MLNFWQGSQYASDFEQNKWILRYNNHSKNVKHVLWVASSESRYTSFKFGFTSYEINFASYEFKSTSCEPKSRIYEFKSTSYKTKKHELENQKHQFKQ